jgi:hypothetical protein
MRWRERLAAGLLAAPFVVGAVVGASAAGPAGGTEVCAFQDPAITEASGLVVTDGLFVTMNDSGDSARVFAVDPHTCRTVGVTRWHADAIDDESLAPAGRPGEVWVGDTGQNIATRPYITIAKVPVGRGDRDVPGEIHKLAYPDGRHDAETLIRNPVTGQLFIVSKEFIGRIYAIPRHLGPGVTTMKAGKTVLGLATDGAFFPDGKHVILRNYGQAAIYTWPALDRIATIDLPRQQQGEGIAVADDGRIYLDSEGIRAPVLELHLPADVRAALAGRAPTGRPAPAEDDAPVWPWLAGGAVVLAGAVVVGVRRRRPSAG